MWLRRTAEAPPAVEPTTDEEWLRQALGQVRTERDDARAEARQLREQLAEATDPQATARITRLERELAGLRRFLAIQSDQLARAERRPEVGASTW